MADVVKEEPVDFDSNWTEDATQIDSSKCDKLPPNEHNNSDEEDVKKDSKFYQVCLTEHWNAGEGTSKQNDGLASTSSTKVKEEKDSENSEMEEDESKSLFEEELHNVEQSMTVEEGDERLENIKKEKHECVHCDFASYSEEELKAHIEQTHVMRKCLVCDYKTEIQSDLIEHLKENHKYNHETKRFHCEYCEYKTTKFVYLHYHIIRCHQKPMLYTCCICNLVTISEHALQIHTDRIHEKVRTFKCYDCDYAAFDKQSLQRHIDRRHKNLKHFKCPLCFYKAFTRTEVKKHVKRNHAIGFEY